MGGMTGDLAIKKASPKLFGLVRAEEKRQRDTIDLIASENFVSLAVRAGQATVFTNKYSEGYPGKRYYPGNEVVDEVERYAQELARNVFGLDPEVWRVNTQALSGAPANVAVYAALMDIGDTLMGLKLSHGGHLSHGQPVSLTGKAYRSVLYELDPVTERIDFDNVMALARAEKPKVIVSGFSAYPRTVDFERFRTIADEVGAYHVVDMAHLAGLIAGGVYTSPFAFADVVTTTTHKTLRGPRGALIFSRKDRFRNVNGKDQPLSDLVDRAVFPGLQGGPHNHQTFAIAVALQEARTPAFRKYQQQIVKNAKALAEALSGYGFRLVSGGTDSHLLLVDLKNKAISDAQLEAAGVTIPAKEDSAGRRVQELLEKAGITANRNTVLGDQSPFRPSGIRLGTPAITTRGMKEKEMKQIARWIHEIVDLARDPEEIRREIVSFLRQFPLP